MSTASIEKSKGIVKNTMYMYMRMAVLMLVQIFTVRVVYQTLGEENYGIYNVVAPVIVFFTFLNNGLAAATKRYIMTGIAEGDTVGCRKTFNICFRAHVIIAGVVLLLAETAGLWVVNEVLNIPVGREFATNVVYQLSVFAALVGIVQSPFSTVIVSYERMDVYAFFTIIDVVLKLLVIYAVQAIMGDKLIIYGALILGVGVINLVSYRWYTYRNFEISRLERESDNTQLREVFGYMGWSLFGQAAVVATNQGSTVLVNRFFTVLESAAMGISNNVTNTVYGFLSNFQVAFNPQIVKSYATGDTAYLKSLLTRAAKMSSYLMILFMVPILFEIGDVLTLWLGDYPKYACEFCIFTLIGLYIDAMASPLWMLVGAQTEIKQYQMVTATIYSMNFFVGIVVFMCGTAPYSIIIVRCVVCVLLLFVRLYFTKKFFDEFDVKTWLLNVPLKSLLIMLLSIAGTGIAARNIELPMLWQILVVTLVSLMLSLPLIYYIGLERGEREKAVEMVKSKIGRR